MVHYDHGMLGATLGVALGAQRRHGWPIVTLTALAAMLPDWDAMAKHVSPRVYQAGHRVWGHNLFAVTLAGVALGCLGYLIHRSIRSRRGQKQCPPDGQLGTWVALCVLVMWTHSFFDLLYCGVGRDLDWPVRLLWPLVPGGFGRPWVPWGDWGATAILAAGLVAIALARSYRQMSACSSLFVLTAYIAVRGTLF